MPVSRESRRRRGPAALALLAVGALLLGHPLPGAAETAPIDQEQCKSGGGPRARAGAPPAGMDAGSAAPAFVSGPR